MSDSQDSVENLDDLNPATHDNVLLALQCGENWRLFDAVPAPSEQIVVGLVHEWTGVIFVGIIRMSAEQRRLPDESQHPRRVLEAAEQRRRDLAAASRTIQAEVERLWTERDAMETETDDIE